MNDNLKNALKYLVLLRDEFNVNANNGWHAGSPKKAINNTAHQARVEVAIESLKQLSPVLVEAKR